MNEQVDFPDNYTFSQRYGYEPFPDAIKLEVLSKDLRRELCNVFVTLVDGFRDRNHNDFFRALVSVYSGLYLENLKAYLTIG